MALQVFCSGLQGMLNSTGNSQLEVEDYESYVNVNQWKLMVTVMNKK